MGSIARIAFAVVSLAAVLAIVGLGGPGLADTDTDIGTVTGTETDFLIVVDPVGTETSVWQGENWSLRAHVTNTGDVPDTQEVRLELGEGDGPQAVQEIQLDPAETRTLTFELPVPGHVRAGPTVATVTTEADSATAETIVGDASVDIDAGLLAQGGLEDVIVRFAPLDVHGLAEPEPALRDHAEATQQDLLNLAEHEEALEVATQYWLANAAVVEVDLDTRALLLLSALDRVEDIHENLAVEPMSSDGGEGDGTQKATISADGSDVTWGLSEINAPTAWSAYGTQGEGARVAVLDTGVDASHQDISLYTEDPTDPTYPGGWAEFDDEGNRVEGSEPYDVNGHGTHVSGTVAGGAASGTHIGVAPNVELLNAGVLTPEGGGHFAAVLAGMQWAVDQDADVMSMSIGSDGYYTPYIEPVRNAQALGTSVVSSIGNSGEGTSGSPANVYDVLSIGASDANHDIASFSSGETIDTSQAWGDEAPSDWPASYVVPDLAAPGVSVYSSVPGDGYDSWHGTSMATPHVSGTAALLTSFKDRLQVDHIVEALEATAWKPAGEPGGNDTRYGAGIIDAKASLDYVDDQLSGFWVSLEGTNSPVSEGESLNVTVSVLNDGDGSDTQTVELLDTDGQRVDARTGLSLDPGEQALFNLTWSTAPGDADFGEVTVASEDLRDATLARIFSLTDPCHPIEPIEIQGDWAFRKAHGVTQGSGTAEDPYVIERWCIAGDDDTPAVLLADTSAHVELRDNVLTDAQRGVHLWKADNVLVVNNTIENNTYRGMAVSHSPGALIEANSIKNNGWTGISVWDTSPGITVRDNEIVANQNNGVWVNSTGSQVQANRIQANALNGVSLSAGTNDTPVHGNEIEANGKHGIFVDGTHTHIENNTMRANGWQGILVWDEAADTTVRSNTIEANDKHGVFVEGTNTHVEDNTIQANTWQGIIAWERAEDTTIRSNTIEANGLRGILLNGGQAHLEANTVQENLDDGISVWETSGQAAIQDNQVLSNGDNGIWLGRSGNEVRANTIEANDLNGVSISSTSNGNVIHDNEMISNGDEGIWVGSQSNEIVDNAVTGNQDYGVRLSGSADANTLTANTITDNANDGIGVATSDNEIVNNTVADNGDDGLSLWEGADRNTLASNTVTDNDDDGIWTGSGSNEIADNTVAGNGDDGVSLGASGEANLLVSNAILINDDDGLFVSSQSNEIDNNTLVDNGDDGLVLWDGADDNTVSWNRIAGNEDGIIVSASSGTVMTRNEITRNENYGLWAQDLSEPFDARENAWGAASGPSGGVADCQTGQSADGDGDRIGTSSAKVCFDPWLSPQFLLSITDTNDPVLGGQDLEVTVRAENTWSVPSTQTLRLEDFDGRTVDTREDLSLAPGESTSLRLTWSTDGWDYGRDEVTVVSESHLDRHQVTILPNPLAS